MYKDFNIFIYIILSIIISFNPIKTKNITEINISSYDYLDIRKLDLLNGTENINNNTKKNLIIGSMINYSWSKLKLYFISLLKTKIKNCDFVVFVGGISNETIKKIESCGVTTYQIPKHIFKLKQHIINFRWKLYKDFLKENKDKYNMVFTVDVRDAIFQKDIFQYFDSSKPFLGVFLEDGLMSSKANRIWVQQFCNESEYKTIENETVICAGAVIGTADKFLEFAQVVWDTIKVKKKVIDQGGVNYLLRIKKLFNDCLIIKDNHDCVMTIGMTNRKNVFLDKDDNILNMDGQIAAVVHQYDRKREIVHKLKIKYNDSFIFSQNNNVVSERNEEFKPKNKAKYIFLILIPTFMIMIYVFYSLINAKRKKSLRNFKKVKLKIYKKKVKTKKDNIKMNFFRKRDYSLIPQDKNKDEN